MFFGARVSKKSGPLIVKNLAVKDGLDPKILHVSNACLEVVGKESQNTKLYLGLSDAERKGEPKTLICILQKDKTENATLDLFVPRDEGLEFSVDGPGEIHVSGYFEPEDDEFSDGDEEMQRKLKSGMDSDSDNDSDKGSGSDSENDKGSGGSDSGADDSVCGSPEDASQSEPEDTADAPSKKKQDLKRKAEVAPEKPGTGKKQKQQPSKQAPGQQAQETKEAKGKKPASAPDAAYEKLLKEYITKNGPTALSALGGKVKKPEGCAKLGAFVKERPALFKVASGTVSLVK